MNARGRGGRSWAAWLSTLAVLAACAAQPIEPVPLRGPAPGRIYLARPKAPAGISPDLLLSGLEEALAERGYGVIPADLSRSLERRFGFDASTERGLRVAAEKSGADAVLRVRAARFSSEQARALLRASYDVEWTLRAIDGALIWRFRLEGDYVRPRDESDVLWAPSYEDRRATPLFARTTRPFRDAGEFVAVLHRSALSRLPRKPP